MQFTHPSFLWALLAIAIPIIIHLFHFRRFKKVYFTNVKFLKEVKEETSNRNRLKHLLVLASRILAVAALVFAFAQPFIPQGEEVKTGQRAVSLFVDNSFSMSSMSQDVALLQKAKQRATEIVEAYQVEDRFQILTNDFEGRHQRLVSKEDALALIEEVKVSPAVKELDKVIARQKQLLNSSIIENKTLYLISDYQKNISNFKIEKDSLLDINLIPLQSVQKQNISLDSCWFEVPVQMINQTNPLVIKVSNLSDTEAENIRLTLKHQGQVKPVGTLSIPPRSSVTDTVNMTILKTGWHEAELTLTDFPVQFDDSYYFSFNVPKEINVLSINDAASDRYLNAAFQSANYFKLTNQLTRNLDYAKFPNYQLIIVNGLSTISSGLAFELTQFAKNGGNLLVFPGANANTRTYNTFLNGFPANNLGAFQTQDQEIGRMNMEEFVFNDVFEKKKRNIKLPRTKGNFKLTNFGSRGEETLMAYRDGATYLGKYRTGQGHLYLCAAPLSENFNDLVRNAEVFVPMLYKMAISSGKERSISAIIGKDNTLDAPNKIQGNEIVYKLKGKKEEFIPQQKTIGAKVIIGVNNQVKEAGFYDLYLNEGELLEKYAFNYDRKESRLDYFSSDELTTMFGADANVIASVEETNFTELIGERSRGITLWRWFLIAALGFLLLEVLLLRFL